MSAAPEAPLVSFVVLAYGQEDAVRAAVAAAFAQTYSPLEILLSDDHSPDGTFAAMAEMAAAYDGPHRVVLNRNPRNLGIAGHVDRIMELVSGELVVIAAGDDVSEPERAAVLAEAWLASGRRAKMLHSAAAVVDEAGRRIGTRTAEPLLVEAPTPANLIGRRLRVFGAAAAWDREIFDRFGPLGPDLEVEDTVLPFRAAVLGDIVYVDRELIRWRAGGISWRETAPATRALLYGVERRMDRWRAQACRHILERFADADYPGKAEVEAVCRREAARCGFLADLAAASHAKRLLMAPRAAATAARLRSARPLTEWLRYLLDEPYIRWRDARMARRRG